MKPRTDLNDLFISILKNRIPIENNLSNELANILPLGKEAIYRRLRNEVPFTFEEITTISLKYGISIDNVIGLKDGNAAVFKLTTLDADNFIDDYCENIQGYVNDLRSIQEGASVKASFAFNTLSYFFYLSYPYLSKFKLYRWLYQVKSTQFYMPFSDIIMPQRVLDVQDQFVKELHQIDNTTIIIDREIITSIIKDINYFYQLGLIKDSELKSMKTELLLLINELESMAISGVNRCGKKILLYLANIHLEASYSYFQDAESKKSYSNLRVYVINSLESKSKTMSEMQKYWIDTLKRFSTLITQSGEIERCAFLRTQRTNILNSLTE